MTLYDLRDQGYLVLWLMIYSLPILQDAAATRPTSYSLVLWEIAYLGYVEERAGTRPYPQ